MYKGIVLVTLLETSNRFCPLGWLYIQIDVLLSKNNYVLSQRKTRKTGVKGHCSDALILIV